MNKQLERLYDSLAEDNAFLTAETERTYNLFYDTFTVGMSPEEDNKFIGMLYDYSDAVEANAFEVGFYTGVLLLWR